tara:strand:- start:2221 stop:2862 length:642 start_codon:yes stop_codon:yes gene_type:complete
MAKLSDVYKTKNNREIVLDAFQANVFEATIEKFKAEGVGGDDIFEETYVLQKEIAEYITGNISSGGGAIGGLAVQTYNYILGIETITAAAPTPIVETPIEPDLPPIEEIAPDLPPLVQESPVVKPPKPKPYTPYRPLKPFKPVRPFKPAVNVSPKPKPRPIIRGGATSGGNSNPFFPNFGGIRGGFGGMNFGNFGENRGGTRPRNRSFFSKFR